MTTPRVPYLRAAIVLAFAAVLSGCCSLPKIVVLHDPLSADEHARLGRIYESQGKEDLALAQYRAGIKKDKRHLPSWQCLGDLSFRMGDYGEAERAFKKALNLQPENGDLYNNLAWTILRQNKKLRKAEELVSKAMDLTPANRPYYLDTLGVILLRQGRTTEAIAALRSSAETIPEDKPALRAEAYGHLAEAYKAAGDDERSREASEQQKRLLLKTRQ